MTYRYSIETGKYGMYFYDNLKHYSMTLQEIKNILNSYNDIINTIHNDMSSKENLVNAFIDKLEYWIHQIRNDVTYTRKRIITDLIGYHDKLQLTVK